MRSPDNLLVAGLIAVLAIVVFVVWFGGDAMLGRALRPADIIPVTNQSEAAAKAADAKNAKTKKEKSAVHQMARNASGPGASSHAQDVSESPTAPPPPAAILNARTTEVVAGSGFPEALRLAIGTTRTELRKRYGSPRFEVTSSREGSLVERYYYSDVDYTNMAVAILRNGKLVSVEKVQY